ncbi:LysE family translocator [Methylomonas sp. AM2-LC]|uniref:LysE family translocator n=1 Tax=Methylomonas sp. AM2-LC TaxID=3153301 RepID=UPI003265C3B5
MLGTHDLTLFVISGLLLNITPGADSLYIVARSVGQGRSAGVAAALGIALGCYLHIFAAAVGLSALLAASSTAFSTLKLIGAVYLVYIGITLMRSTSPCSDALKNSQPASLRSIFRQGFLTNVLNPKVAIFFLAFVPQFIEHEAPNKALAFIFLGGIFNFTGTIWCLFLAWFADHLNQRLSPRKLLFAWLTRTAGGVFVFLGFKLAVSKQN